MKRQVLWIAVAMLASSTSLVAQSSNNVDEVVRIERHTARNYREGEMIVKFKPTGAARMQSLTRGVSAGVNKVDEVFCELGVTASEQLMPLSGTKVMPRAKALRSVSGKSIEDSDMSQLYRLTFDATKVNVYEAVDKLAALDEVEYAEPNYVVYALSEENSALYHHDDHEHYCKEPLYTEQWGHHPLKIPFLWQQPKLSDKRPVIAILDTGVDITHPDLTDNIWTNETEENGAEGDDDDNNGFADDLHGWDFVNQTARLGDWNGHGTHCAGIAAAVGKNGIGITGANPDALIMPVTVMQSDGTGDVATIIKGIDYAAANGADIISMSIGGYGYSIAEEQALAKAYSTAVLVAAAGNDCMVIGPPDSPTGTCPVCYEPGAPVFPAAFTFVLGVEASDTESHRAGFSNYDPDGPVFSYYSEEKLYNYELRAPGTSIMSTYPGGKYKKLSGTSMACPYIAGGLSRLLQTKEYSSWEVLFGDLIHTRKLNNYGDVDFEAAYKITNEDRKPTLWLVGYELKDTIEGDGDGRPDAGETIAFYPILRNDWGQAEDVTFSLEVGENEDPTIVEIIDTDVPLGKSLSSYAKAKSTNPLRFKVNADCADGRHIRLVLRATCDNIAEDLVQEITITVENGVEIGGMITEDMTLYPNLHYIVTRPLAVPEGVTLTIEPGTVLEFRDDIGLSVSGKIDCHGAPDSLIVFTYGNAFDVWDIDLFDFGANHISYVLFDGLEAVIRVEKASDCIVSYNFGRTCVVEAGYWERTNFFYNTSIYSIVTAPEIWNNNIISNTILEGGGEYLPMEQQTQSSHNSNIFNNVSVNSWGYMGDYNVLIDASTATIQALDNIYLGSTVESIARKGVLDMYHPTNPVGFGMIDLKTASSVPSADAHGIVWKVVINGYDAQDEFDQMPPLGVGKHKFEVYFNRPMNKKVAPMIAMGVRPPYTSHTIAEDGSWNEEGTIYTVYLTITGKTGTDGLNRIYVAEAEDNEYFEIPIENMRFNVEIAAAGSMATGLMAEAGLGKVSLTWETDEEDFADLLGYNIYRYTDHVDSTYVEWDEDGNWIDQWIVIGDTTIINSTVLDSEETSFVDYDVEPGTTYYYVIKQLTTSLNSHALSNAVAATPLTASKGDANGSMNVDIADVVTEVAYITYQDPQPFIFEAADVNSDAKVNVLDVVGTIGIITTPAEIGVSGIGNELVRYYVQDGVLYMENTQPLGGVQVHLGVAKGTAITALEALAGMEQTSVWTSDSEYLFLAYSMSGRSIPAGTHALLQIGSEAVVTEMVLSDTKGKNITAVDGNATGIGKVEAVQLQMPSPNPFTTVLQVPYTIGKSGSHEVTIAFSDMAGRTIDAYHTVNTPGEYTYTWHPRALQKGLYLVSLYLDGELMQTVKVICNN